MTLYQVLATIGFALLFSRKEIKEMLENRREK